MKYSICIEMLFNEYKFEERIKKVREYGFDYFEFWTWQDKNLPAIKKAMEESKTRVASISGDDMFSLVNGDEMDEYVSFIEKSIKVAKELGSNFLVIHSNALEKDGSAKKMHRQISGEAKLINMYETLRQLKSVVEQQKIYLVLEPLNSIVDHKGYFLDTPGNAFELVKAVNSEYIKVLFDIYHMQIMNGNIIDTIISNICHIGYIHAADVPGRHEPGTGELNLKNVIRAIEQAGYSGFVGFELSPLNSSGIALEKIIKVLQ